MRDFLAAGLARVAAALLTAFVLTVAVILLAHGSPVAALSALASGAFGTRYDVGNTLTKTTPLLLTGLGVAIAFRARLWNIGGEGQILMGALAACALGAYRLHGLPAAVLLPLMLDGRAPPPGHCGPGWPAGCGSRAVSPKSSAPSCSTSSPPACCLIMLHGPLQQKGADSLPGYAEPLPPAATLPILVPETPLHWGFLLALAALVVVALLMGQTPTGFAIRAVGANADAARVAGIGVERTQMVAMLWSGALCGLAGAVELSGVVGHVVRGVSERLRVHGGRRRAAGPAEPVGHGPVRPVLRRAVGGVGDDGKPGAGLARSGLRHSGRDAAGAARRSSGCAGSAALPRPRSRRRTSR